MHPSISKRNRRGVHTSWGQTAYCQSGMMFAAVKVKGVKLPPSLFKRNRRARTRINVSTEGGKLAALFTLRHDVRVVVLFATNGRAQPLALRRRCRQLLLPTTARAIVSHIGSSSSSRSRSRRGSSRRGSSRAAGEAAVEAATTLGGRKSLPGTLQSPLPACSALVSGQELRGVRDVAVAM